MEHILGVTCEKLLVLVGAFIALASNAACVAEQIDDPAETGREVTVDAATAGAIVDEGRPATSAESHVSQGRLPDGGIIVHTGYSDQELKIQAALQQITNCEFAGNPLSDIFDYLSVQHQFPVVFQRAELAKAGIADPLDVEGQLVLSGASLAHAIDLLLSPHGLGYYVDNDVLNITTIQDTVKQMETRVYNVRSLRVTDPEVLADVLIHTTGDESWKDFGGPGDLSFFNGSFIVRQNLQTHEQIEHVLNQLAEDVRNSAESPEWGVRTRAGKSESPQMKSVPKLHQPLPIQKPGTLHPQPGT